MAVFYAGLIFCLYLLTLAARQIDRIFYESILMFWLWFVVFLPLGILFIVATSR